MFLFLLLALMVALAVSLTGPARSARRTMCELAQGSGYWSAVPNDMRLPERLRQFSGDSGRSVQVTSAGKSRLCVHTSWFKRLEPQMAAAVVAQMGTLHWVGCLARGRSQHSVMGRDLFSLAR